MHLLVLDDDDRLTDFIASVARRQGWTVDTAGWVTTFHALFSARKPDAIMLDLQLGVSDGIEQLHFLHGKGFSGPVVLMSGFDARVLASAQKVGTSLGMTIATVIEKPARTARMIEVLQGLGKSMLLPPITEPHRDPRTVPSCNVLISCDSIAGAICAGEMELYLQPIVSTADGTVRRAEGLIRWHHPASGVISPDRFIPVAEQSDELIDQLTQWVIKAALQKYRALSEHGLDIQVCINLSGRNLHSLEFPDQLSALLREASVPTDAIGLEVTESAAMRDIRATTDILTRLRLKGFSIAVDDFGTGFSSLDALRQMPFSAIKIDKGFVIGLPKARDSLTIVRSVINLAHDLGLGTVAEGVETQEVAELLTDLGCSSLQGYYFSRPVAINQFINWCQSRARTWAAMTAT